jgi:hypothetical protein
MARRFSSNTVRSVGALLPADVLAKAIEGEGLDGLEPEDYGVEADERFRDVVNDAWNEARSLWWNFQSEFRALSEEDASASSLTRERWLIPLLELLGFQDMQVEARSLEVSGTEYPISHSWNGTPLHLMGARIDLDGRVSGIPGAARLSPHSLLQQFLNRSDDHLWGIVSNGLQLRVLRDSVSLTRQAFVQFDLEALFNGEVFPDFVLLYRVVHATRFRGERPEECLLEKWIAAARDEGIRALDQLRDGVESALTELGIGFLTHPDNSQLRKSIAEEDLGERDLYRFLLRLVYRLLFLFVAEDRNLLLIPDTPPETRDRYDRYYSSGRLRDLAARPATSGHTDLWAGLGVLMRILGRDEGEPALGLPGLGSFLWNSDAIGILIDSRIDNDRLLQAIRDLAYVEEAGMLRRIDFTALGAEELGSVYESLLELHPNIDQEERTFSLGEGAGSERKTTGSYYTPTALISELLDSALDPVLEEAANKDDPDAAILDLKVVDPAAGSGHFLVAAAHRIAKRLAEVRTGEPEPPEDEYRGALRDVVSRCLFAVDMNDLAVELCKVSLWLEALESGKPLSFLDHHILLGNSLFGATPSAIAAGVPNEAFVPLTDDDKKVVTALKKRNRQERGGQDELIFDSGELKAIGRELEALEAFDDSDLETVRTKERMLASYKSSPEYQHAKLVADAWCAAFAIEKTVEAPKLTEGVFRRLRDEGSVAPETRSSVEELADRHHFFHWHLGFPQVFGVNESLPGDGPGWTGGFDVVLGNPPWERVKLQEKEFFTGKAPEIANAPNKAARQKLINRLPEEDPTLWRSFRSALHEADAISHFLRRSEVYPLCGRGDVNTYAVFAELMRSITGPTGRTGLIVPTGIATDATTQFFFSDLVESQALVSLFDFENRKAIFPGIHRSYKFSLVTLSGSDRPIDEAEFCFFALSTAELGDEERRFTLAPDDFALLNPNTRTCPIFRTRRDAEITRDIYKRVPVLVDDEREGGNPWGVQFSTMFHMSNDSGHFGTSDDLQGGDWSRSKNLFVRGEQRFLPLYEAKMIHHFNHRWATFDHDEFRATTAEELADPSFVATPRYWVAERLVRERVDSDSDGWLLGFRNITNATNERTFVATAVPLYAVGHSMPLIWVSDHRLPLLSVLCSFAFDFVVRQKLGGTNMTYFIVEQTPVPPPAAFESEVPWRGEKVSRWLAVRALELLETSADIKVEMSAGAAVPFYWSESRRSLIRAELDAFLFYEYGIGREDVDYIMETFPIVKRHDIQEHGSYRTKELILDVYDRMAAAIETGEPYQSILDPPPADPSLRIDVDKA